MTDHFDPYHRWLGIPPKYQPADHYRLLGLERFEDDPEVIVDAAERQMAHVRRYALGPNQSLSQRILNELAAAQACLIDPIQKARYDADLQQRQAAVGPQAAPLPAAPTPVAPQVDIPSIASPTVPKPVKIENATSQRPTVPDPVPASRDAVPPHASRRSDTGSAATWLPRWLDERLVAWAGSRFPGQLSMLRALAVGVPLVLVLASLLVAFGLSTNPRPVDTVASDSGPAAVLEPVVEPAPKPTPEPVSPPSPPVVTRPPSIRAIPDQTSMRIALRLPPVCF